MNRIRTVAVFPTVFTLANLICGFFAIVVAARVERPTSLERPQAVDIVFKDPTRVIKQLDPTNDTHNIMLSGWLIFLAMIFDALDGHVARLARLEWTSDGGEPVATVALPGAIVAIFASDAVDLEAEQRRAQERREELQGEIARAEGLDFVSLIPHVFSGRRAGIGKMLEELRQREMRCDRQGGDG